MYKTNSSKQIYSEIYCTYKQYIGQDIVAYVPVIPSTCEAEVGVSRWEAGSTQQGERYFLKNK
jgi:hypothetical protein